MKGYVVYCAVCVWLYIVLHTRVGVVGVVRMCVDGVVHVGVCCAHACNFITPNKGRVSTH